MQLLPEPHNRPGSTLHGPGIVERENKGKGSMRHEVPTGRGGRRFTLLENTIMVIFLICETDGQNNELLNRRELWKQGR